MQKKFLTALALVASFFLLTSQPTVAKVMSGEQLVVAADEIIADDLFIAGSKIEIFGQVDGDIYAAGDTIVFAGQTSGDLIAVAGNIEVTGEIEEDLRIFAGNINISNAQIGSALTAAGASVNVAENVEVGQSSMIAGANNVFAGQTKRHLLLAGANNRVSGQIGKDLFVGGETINLDSQASVSGNLLYGSDRELNLADRATVAGQISRRELPVQWEQGRKWANMHQRMRWPKFAGRSFGFFSFLLWALLLIALWPKLFKNMAKKIEAQPGRNILIGLLASLLILPVFLFLLLTIVGIPLAFLFIMWTILLSIFVKAFVAVWLGQKAFAILQPKPKQKNIIWQFLLGYVIYFLIALIPGLGWLWRSVVTMMGVGVVYSSIFERQKKK